jgi:hypothetical protein
MPVGAPRNQPRLDQRKVDRQLRVHRQKTVIAGDDHGRRRGQSGCADRIDQIADVLVGLFESRKGRRRHRAIRVLHAVGQRKMDCQKRRPELPEDLPRDQRLEMIGHP